MSNDNSPINGAPAPAPLPELEVARHGVVVATVPVTLEGGTDYFEVSLREPGIVRAIAFRMEQPKVIASAMRGVQPVPQPVLFVEMRTDGELKRRSFFIVAPDMPLAMKPGFAAEWRGTAMLPNGAGHLFEVVEAAS